MQQILSFARAVSKNKPYKAAKLQDSTDPRKLVERVRAAVKHKFSDKIKVMHEQLPNTEDAVYWESTRFYFLNMESGETWYSIEVELIVDEAGKAQPAAHWVRNLLQLQQQ